MMSLCLAVLSTALCCALAKKQPEFASLTVQLEEYFDKHNVISHEHQHLHPKSVFVHSDNKPAIHLDRTSVQGSDVASLTATPSMLKGPSTGTVTVSWANVSYQSSSDFIALYNYSDEDPFNTGVPPIKYRYICVEVDCYNGYPPYTGSIGFEILNRRTKYFFAYMTPNTPYMESKAVSNVISFDNLDVPMHVHISWHPTLTNDAGIEIADSDTDDIVAVMWVQRTIDKPVIKYGTNKDNLNMVAVINRTDISTYKREDFCDRDLGMIAGTVGFFEPGWMITGILSGLSPLTMYYYQVGDDAFGYSPVFNFTTKPKNGELGSVMKHRRKGDDNSSTLKWVGFGDLGNVAIDWSKHHSWDWSNDGELYSVNTTRMIQTRYMDGPDDFADFVYHTGDISYAVGYLSEWDDFLHQISPVASHIPWMTGIGNHEYSWSQEWKPPSSIVDPDAYGNGDSDGECGVPYNTYFPFSSSVNPWSDPRPSVRKPWYVFDYGIVRHVIISTEHDYSKGSEQYTWLSNVLANTNRDLFPWLMVSGHRPMYVNSGWDGDLSTSQYLVQELEDLLVRNKVSIGTWGHAHAYSRTCPIINYECQSEGSAPVHIVFGMAGYELTAYVPNPPANYFEAATNQVYGFMHFSVEDSVHCQVKFINSETGDIVDSFTVTNPYQS